ncbi:MAG: PKD domain-containing protein [Deltaproteobacteria bacterium]|nr:PKD domain-containing protein [Deltaproteobacteria bacterium]
MTDDDDTDVDDDNGPVDDDLDDDTDDGPDDDMDDDDTGTPNREPLAVLDCSPVCAAVDEEVSFSAEDTVDPEDGALNFVYDFGDGHNASDVTAAHAYEAPGAYRVTLTVTDDNGWVDTSSCIVSVGDFPVGMGTMDVLDLMPNHYDPAIIETQPKPDHGGVLWGFFRRRVGRHSGHDSPQRRAGGPGERQRALVRDCPGEPAGGRPRHSALPDE